MKLLAVIVVAIVALTLFTFGYYATNNAVYSMITVFNSTNVPDASLNDTMHEKFNQTLNQWSYLPIYFIVMFIIGVFLGALAKEWYDRPVSAGELR